MLNGIWLGLLTVAALLAGLTGRLGGMTDGAIQGANAAVTVSLGLIGVMALWLGILRLAEQAGLVTTLARILQPVLGRLFPEVPPGHPALGSIVLNVTANALGLTNAATPMGLRAMRDLQRLNPQPDTASNAMCTFLAINTQIALAVASNNELQSSAPLLATHACYFSMRLQARSIQS